MKTEDEILRRYRDSFGAAQATDKFGDLSEIAAFASAGIIAFIGLLLTFIVAGTQRDYGIAFVVFLIVLTVGAIVGSIFYCIGILLSAVGHIQSASLDSAISCSPLLSDEQKALALNAKN